MIFFIKISLLNHPRGNQPDLSRMIFIIKHFLTPLHFHFCHLTKMTKPRFCFKTPPSPTFPRKETENREENESEYSTEKTGNYIDH